MICPTCKEEGEVSTVTPGMTMVTLMGYSPGHYDEAGEWVRHPDPNWRTTPYHCSRGHGFQVVSKEGESDRVRPDFTRIVGPCFSPPGEFTVTPAAPTPSSQEPKP